MANRTRKSGGAKSRVPPQVAAKFNDKPDPLRAAPLRPKDSETSRKERAQGGQRQARSSKDPYLGPV